MKGSTGDKTDKPPPPPPDKPSDSPPNNPDGKPPQNKELINELKNKLEQKKESTAKSSSPQRQGAQGGNIRTGRTTTPTSSQSVQSRPSGSRFQRAPTEEFIPGVGTVRQYYSRPRPTD